MDIILAVLLGTFFGFVLQRIGAADPDKIINMLRLKDLRLIKTIIAGIGVSSILLFAGIVTGLMDNSHLSVKSMYWGVIIGGAIFGLGWAMSGFCPGTAVAGAGSGRIDALFFLAGGLIGAGLYTIMYGAFKDTSLLAPLFGGKVTLAQTGRFETIFTSVPGWMFAVVMGLAFIIIGYVLPEQVKQDE